MTTVAQLLKTKGDDIWSVKPTDSVFDAINAMAGRGIGAVLVMDGDDLVGILSERDYARKVVLAGRSSRETSVAEIMTADVVHTTPDTPIEQCMRTMTDKHFRHLPVMEDGRVIGVVSIGDLVKVIIVEQQELIKQLERYISG